MSRSARGGGRERSFTLVEVLATLALVAIVLPVAMRGISLATAAAGTARRQTEAAALADSKLAELLATGAWRGPELAGDFGTDLPGYRWTAEVSDWETGTLKQVTVRVEWTARAAKREVALSTLVYAQSQ